MRHPSIGTESRPARPLLSLFIAGVITTQFFASFGRLHPFRYWPFLSYPMYNQAHRAGEAVPAFSLVAVDDAGHDHSLTPQDLNLEFWRMLRGPVRAAQRGDVHALLRYLEPFEHRTHVRVTAVRLESHPMRLANGRLESMPAISTLIVVRPT